MAIDPIGLLLVVAAGACAGGCAWPVKLLRRFALEHWAFVSWLVGLVVLPWLGLLLACPDAGAAIAAIPGRTLLVANAWSLAWGIANVLCCVCLVRIGIGLTVGLLTGIGLPIGMLVPMVVRGSGGFAGAPALDSPAGHAILAGAAVMVLAVGLVAWAGFAREAGRPRQGGGFLGGMLMAALAGLLQVGLSFAFVYSQGPIVAAFTTAGAGPLAADLGLWALALPGGALVNLAYPAWLMTRRRSWHVLAGSWREIGLSALVGVNFFGFALCYGQGCRMLGAAGAAIGFGVYQAAMIAASQTVGVISGEWRGVSAQPRWLMAAGIALLLAAVLVMAGGQG
jgi:hypothetical protein